MVGLQTGEFAKQNSLVVTGDSRILAALRDKKGPSRSKRWRGVMALKKKTKVIKKTPKETELEKQLAALTVELIEQKFKFVIAPAI